MWQLTALMTALVAAIVTRTDGSVQLLDDNTLENFLPELTFDGGKASVKCDKGYLEIELNFNKPFSGVVSALNSSCHVRGDGTYTVGLNIFYNESCVIKGGVGEFYNDISISYNPAYEATTSPAFTAKCFYGPPIVVPSAPLVIKGPSTVSPPAQQQAQSNAGQNVTKAIPSLMILCGILFLSLVLLGLLTSYYILKRRRFQVIRQLPSSTRPGSKISKLTDTNTSTYEELSIPRSKLIPPAGRSLDSDGDSYQSGYISESPRSGHTSTFGIARVVHHPDGSDYKENKGIVHDDPKYDWMQFTEPPLIESGLSPNADQIQKMKEKHLINYLEQKSFSPASHNLGETNTLEMAHQPFPRKETIQAVYSEITKNTRTDKKPLNANNNVSKLESFNTADSGVGESNRIQRDYLEMKPKKSARYAPGTFTEQVDLPVTIARQPEVTKSIIEDVFLKTIIEKRTIEEIERHKTQEIIPNIKPQHFQPKWGVTIKNYPNPNALPTANEEASDWDSFSETSSLSSYSHSEHHRGHQSELDTQQNYRSYIEIPLRDPLVKNWDVLIKVLRLPQRAANQESYESHRVEQTLTLEDRKKWKEIITTESTLRNLLSKATTREDFEKIRKNQCFEILFEPKKWDMIIEVLAPAETFIGGEEPARNRVGSLSTVYEYDSDGASSVQTLRGAHDPSGEDVTLRSRRTSRSSLRSNVRSVGELTVSHALQTVQDDTMYF